jgi:glycosyltransferase involved in cell wall biosynthesis
MLVGNGPLEDELKALSHELNLSDRVIFAGFAADPWPYYASADLFILSSDREGYPNVLVEAMLSGTTVVSTDCGSGPRQIIDDGRCGQLVPVGDEAALADAMEEALRAPTSVDVLLDRTAQLSSGAAARRYLELLLGPSDV